MSDDLTSRGPQFQTAEYPGQPAGDHCHSCGQSISGTYYRLNGGLACPACAEKARFALPQDSSGSFIRALLLGAGGALLGLILYSGVGIITGWMIGYVSLAVGYIVGKAMMKGSSGIGGRRYQVAAAVLTYAAVSLSAIPIAISQFAEQKALPKTQTIEIQPNQQPQEKADAAAGAAAQQEEISAAPGEAESSLGLALGMLVLIGLASPFLALETPFNGVIGLIILFIGIQIAWKLTAGKTDEILGPFHSGAEGGDTPA